MLEAATFGVLVLGVDLHMVMVPTPGGPGMVANATPLAALAVPFHDERGADVVVELAKATFLKRGRRPASRTRRIPSKAQGDPRGIRRHPHVVVAAASPGRDHGAEEQWSARLSDELARDRALFDALYEDLLGRALSLWVRPVEPLDRDVEAWMTFQRHALKAGDPGRVARHLGLTLADELRLARLWRGRLATPEIAARAEAAWSGPLPPLPKLTLGPIHLPPTLGGSVIERTHLAFERKAIQ